VLSAATTRRLLSFGGLTPSQRLVLVALINHTNGKGATTVGNAGIVSFTGLSEQTVRRRLAELVEQGRVERRDRPGFSPEWAIVVNPPLPEVAPLPRVAPEGLREESYMDQDSLGEPPPATLGTPTTAGRGGRKARPYSKEQQLGPRTEQELTRAYRARYGEIKWWMRKRIADGLMPDGTRTGPTSDVYGPLGQALVEACDWTYDEEYLRKLVAQLEQDGRTPEQVHQAADAARKIWRSGRPTPAAITRQMPQLLREAERLANATSGIEGWRKIRDRR
jgi:hypothetical protein